MVMPSAFLPGALSTAVVSGSSVNRVVSLNYVSTCLFLLSQSHYEGSEDSVITTYPQTNGIVANSAAVVAPKQSFAQQQSLRVQVSTTWYQIPEVVRYAISGNIGNVCFYICEQLVNRILKIPAAGSGAKLLLPSKLEPYLDTISFFLGYIIHVPAQHYSHALLVYGLESINTVDKYLTTLAGMYSAMIAACIGSTMLNAALLQYTNLPKTWAFLATMTIFSVFNYFVIGYIVQKSNEDHIKKK